MRKEVKDDSKRVIKFEKRERKRKMVSVFLLFKASNNVPEICPSNLLAPVLVVRSDR